jgi:hypothetical protein
MDDAIVKSLAGRKAIMTRRYGAGDARTIAATRELAAAHLAVALDRARTLGLAELDVAAIVKTGRLPAEVAA